MDNFLSVEPVGEVTTGSVEEIVEDKTPAVEKPEDKKPIKEIFKPKEEKETVEEVKSVKEVKEVKTVKRNINVRSTPQVSLNWIGLIYSGSEVNVLDMTSNDEWCYVEYNGVEWWISYLAFIPKPVEKISENNNTSTNYEPQNPNEYIPPVVNDNFEYHSYCGDGIVQTPNSNDQYEQCDDGNTYDGDLCSSICLDNEFNRDDDSIKEDFKDMSCAQPIVQLVCNLGSHYCPEKCRKSYVDYDVLDF